MHTCFYSILYCITMHFMKEYLLLSFSNDFLVLVVEKAVNSSFLFILNQWLLDLYHVPSCCLLQNPTLKVVL